MKAKEGIDFIPLRNDVLIERIEIKQKSVIKLPDQVSIEDVYSAYYRHPFQGKIVALPRAYDRDYVFLKKRREAGAHGEEITKDEIDMLIDFKVGDIVALEQVAGKLVVLKGEKYILVKDYEILGIIKKA